MKHSVGTATSCIVYTRVRQKGNRKCKECIHLQYTANPTAECNYRCAVSGTPTAYTKRCFCKHFKAKA